MFKGVDKKTKNCCLRFIFACFFLYLMSMCIKMAYSSEMAEIIVAIGSNKPDVSLGLLIYYAAYCVAQLLFAVFISKMNLKWFISITVSLTALSFGMMLIVSELWHLYLILGLNGFFQTGIWGGIMYFVGKYVPKEMESFASKLLATGVAVGTAIAYGASFFFIYLLDWRYTFLFFAILSVVSIVLFLLSLKSAEKNLAFVARQKAEENKIQEQTLNAEMPKTKEKGGVFFFVIFFTVVITLLSCIYYAFIGWFPNLLIENFAMPTEYSILITLLLPLTMTPSSIITIELSQRSKSDYNVSIIFTTVITGLMVALLFGYSLNIVLTIIVSVLIFFGLRGLMSMIGTYFPLKYKDRIEAGKFSLILNAFAALVGGVMPYATAFVLENSGWTVYFIILCALSVIPLIMLTIARIFENKKVKL